MKWLFSSQHSELKAVSGGDPAALARQAEAFLSACSQSSERRWSALEALADALYDQERQEAALRLVHCLRVHPSAQDSAAPLRVMRVPLVTASVESHLDLVIVPSVFEPEDWGFTFLEGLLRRPARTNSEQTLAEIGTGTGWISLAMLLHAGLDTAVGYDINPIAIQVSRINAVVNSFSTDLSPRYDASRRLLYERFEARQSDLLSAAIDEGDRYDLVVGCIPQVLAPSPDLDPEKALVDGDEDSLYDLSNYFVLQGVYEDQFGLGLLAKALDQVVRVMSDDGRVVLNIAGRPGTRVIDRMFNRRGFDAQVVWSTRVQQAADTDIEVLATLETRTGQPFEFYVGKHSRQSIGAATAQALRETHRPIWHDVRVYEASLRFERDMRGLLDAVRALHSEDLFGQLDLSRIGGEQLSYLRALSERLAMDKRAPYTHEEGGTRLRTHISNYLERFYGLGGGPGGVFVGPCRQEVLHGLLRVTCEPGQAVLVSASMAPLYALAFEKAGVRPIVGNDDLDELVELVEALKPTAVVLSLSPDERRNSAALRRLLTITAAGGVPLVFDGSDDFLISSHQHRNALLDFLGREGLPNNAFVLVGLIANRVYPNLKPALLVGATGAVREAMVAFAEATYSRNNTFAEHYYEHLFEEILSFQLKRPGQSDPPKASDITHPQKLSGPIKAVMSWPAFESAQPYEGQAPLIRLDHGENELPMPDRLIKGILLGFTNITEDASAQRTREAVSGFSKAVMGWPVRPQNILLGAGVFPLLFDLTLAMGRREGRRLRVALPQGHYGYLPPIFTLAGADVIEVETTPEDGHMLTTAGLEQAASERGPIDILMLNNPANPAGISYPLARLKEVAGWASRSEAFVFSDEIFSLLCLGEGEARQVTSFYDVCGDDDGLRSRVVAFTGLSKAFAAGGLRVGWASSEDEELLASARALRTTPVTRHAHAACEVLLRGFRGDSVTDATEEVFAALDEMRSALRLRRGRLVSLLEKHGLWVPTHQAAGLFIFPSLAPLSGRVFVDARGQRHTLTPESTVEVLRTHCGLALNPGQWAAVPGHARICFSLTQDAFEVALRRLDTFLTGLEGAS